MVDSSSNNMVGQLKILFVSKPPPAAAGGCDLAPLAVMHWESSIKFFCEVVQRRSFHPTSFRHPVSLRQGFD